MSKELGFGRGGGLGLGLLEYFGVAFIGFSIIEICISIVAIAFIPDIGLM